MGPGRPTLPRSWHHLVEEELPILDDLLRKFVVLYDALEDKSGYQVWFMAWWKWWCLHGINAGRPLPAYSARFFYSTDRLQATDA